MSSAAFRLAEVVPLSKGLSLAVAEGWAPRGRQRAAGETATVANADRQHV